MVATFNLVLNMVASSAAEHNSSGPGGPNVPAPAPVGEILAGLVKLTGHFGDDEYLELRALSADGQPVVARHYAAGDLAGMAAAARSWSAGGRSVYLIVNPLKDHIVNAVGNATPTLLALFAAHDCDVARRRRLFIDVDPVRPPGMALTCATDAERTAAREVAELVRDYLVGVLGWPAPVVVDSGSGVALLFAVELPNDAAATALVRRVLLALAARFDSAEAKIDTTVFNASRLCRIPGTVNRKGEHTPERPHRTGGVLDAPDVLEPVAVELLEQLAAEAPETPQPGGAAGGAGSAEIWAAPEEVEGARERYRKYLEAAGGAKSGHGGSNKTLRLACVGFEFGLPATVVLEELRSWNKICEPEWSEPELVHKVEDAEEKVRAKGNIGCRLRGPAADPFTHTDAGNARRFVARYGHLLRYCAAWKCWLVYDGRRWTRDQTGTAERLAKALFIDLAREAAMLPEGPDRRALLKHAVNSESAKAVKATVELAKSEAEVAVPPDVFDADVWLLNVLNGTLDLRTGELRAHDAGDFITKLAPTEYHPHAPAEHWEGFVKAVFGGSQELIGFVQRLLGCCCTGDTSEQIFPIFHGPGANGKSTLTDVVLDVLGSDYARVAPPELLMATRGDRHPAERAMLYGLRLVVAAETSEGGRLNEALVKAVTGGDKITARGMKENFWSFSPTHKIILCTNHAPQIRGTDEGVWRRVKSTPFPVRFWDPDVPPRPGEVRSEGLKQDKNLKPKLVEERAGVLRWLVEGCLAWRAHGLGCPPEVQRATSEYRARQDVLGQFLAECCQVGPKDRVRVKANVLYGAYKQWMENNGLSYISHPAFTQAMTTRDEGFEHRKIRGVMVYKGVTLP
jgi:P4 family phage/plasmid primase-like protien